MTLSILLERLFKYLFLICACVAGILHLYKDDWPAPAYYDLSQLEEPLQTATDREPFTIDANGLSYTIKPKYEYELQGIVVSFSNADGFTNIWHHKRWHDFINVRDICVIWGENVESGVYKQMKFDSDSWTCWAYWPNQEVGKIFSMYKLSNNHIVTDDDAIKAALMQAEPGDHIRFTGVLAEYVNHAGGYTRGTSITRNDTGQGACETIYLDDFEIVKKANPKLRRFAKLFNWLTLITFLGFVVSFLIAPARRYR